MSIRTRITLLGVGIVTLVICCLSASLFGLISRGLDTDRDRQLAARAEEAVASIALAGAADFTPAGPLAPIDPRSNVDVFIMVLDADGIVAVGYDTAPEGNRLPAVWTSVDGLRWSRNAGAGLDEPGHRWMNGAAIGSLGLIAVGGDGTRPIGDPAVWRFR